jgi:hypothetical protein
MFSLLIEVHQATQQELVSFSPPLFRCSTRP